MRRFVLALYAGLPVTFIVLIGPAIADNITGKPDGRALYARQCAVCHDKIGMGTGLLARRVEPALLAQRTDLDADYISMAVRSGIGNMPRFSRAELTDDELAQISIWLTDKNRIAGQ